MTTARQGNREAAVIYRLAAHKALEDEGFGMCHAIRKAGDTLGGLDSFTDLCVEWMSNLLSPFSGDNYLHDSPNGTEITRNDRVIYWARNWSDSADEVHDCRVLALCLMGAIADAGDL
jgi:hypothetical protein